MFRGADSRDAQGNDDLRGKLTFADRLYVFVFSPRKSG